jgi:prefoldin subunit 5
VIDDMNAAINQAINQVEALMAATSAINGTLTYSAETTKTVAFVTALTSSTYRVQLDSSAFVGLRVIGKTLTGFTIEASAAFTGTVGYDVFV